MLNIESFAINNAIIHRLNNRKPDGLELSAFSLEIENEFKDVLEIHSKNALTDKKIRYTKYNDVDENYMHNITTAFFTGKTGFIDYSHQVAKSLFSFMASKTISSGDLLVADININNERHIALLKLDYKDQYLSKVEVIEGQKKISLEKKDNAWPEAGTRLQKAAFIRNDLNLNDVAVYDLIMLDRQNRQTGIDDKAASLFFSNNFLKVSLIEDNDTNTVAFIRGAQEIKDKYESLGISPSKAKEIYDHAINIVTTVDTINIDNFTENFFNREDGHEEQFNEVKSIFSSHGLNRKEFDKSQEIAKSFLKNRKIFLEGVKLIVDNHIYANADRFFYKEYKNSSGKTVVDINIKGIELKKLE